LPKLDEGMAGSGMHLHLAVRRDGRNVMTREDGELSDDALGMIGGLLEQAGPLTAFGSTVAASYLRLVPGQEAPTSICWGRRNRSSLVRVPLDFGGTRRLDQVMNPSEQGAYPADLARPTVEYRSPDGSAIPLLLLAAVTLCAERGLTWPESLELAHQLEVRRDGGRPLESFRQLPDTAVAAAAALHEGRGFFEQRGMPARLIDHVVSKLEEEKDTGLTEKLRRLPAAERLKASRRLMHKDLHKH
jgi:glutamine synthetase